MTPNNGPITEDDLQAYIDGELTSDRRALVESQLQDNPDEKMRVTAYQSQSHILHSAFDGILDEPVPARIMPSSRSNTVFNPLGIAAGIALFVAGSLTGWFAKDTNSIVSRPPNFTQHAVAAHRVYTKENRHAVEVVAAQEKHLVKWLSKRFGQSVKTPELSNFGYELVGGRLLAPVENVPAAQFMYQNEKLNRLTLYIRRVEKSETTSFRFEQKGAVTMFYWIDSPMAYALVGEVPRTQLLEISNKVYDQISK